MLLDTALGEEELDLSAEPWWLVPVVILSLLALTSQCRRV